MAPLVDMKLDAQILSPSPKNVPLNYYTVMDLGGFGTARSKCQGG